MVHCANQLPAQLHMNYQVLSVEAYDPSRHMVLDTGCERMVSGPSHVARRAEALAQWSLQVLDRPEDEQFVYGDKCLINRLDVASMSRQSLA